MAIFHCYVSHYQRVMLESTSRASQLSAFRLKAVVSVLGDSLEVFEGTTKSLRSSMSSWRFGGDDENCHETRVWYRPDKKPDKLWKLHETNQNHIRVLYRPDIRNTTKNHKDMINYDGMTRPLHRISLFRSTIYQALQKVYKMRCIGVGGMTCDFFVEQTIWSNTAVS